MRCVACDKNLNDYESTRKDLHGQYLDMCNDCYSTIMDDVLTVGRDDLAVNEVLDELDDTPLEIEEYQDD